MLTTSVTVQVHIEQYGMSDKYPQPRILAVQTTTSSSTSVDEAAMDLTSRRVEGAGGEAGAEVADAATSVWPPPPPPPPPSSSSMEARASLACTSCPAKFGKELALR